MWFEILNIIATLSFLILPAVIFVALPDKVGLMGQVLIVLLILAVGLACAVVPDPPLANAQSDKADFSGSALITALKNGPLLRILVAYVSVGIAVSGTAATYLWAAKWGFELESGAELVLVVFFISGVVCMPAWIAWSKRAEKHSVVMWICFAGGFWWMALGAALSGMGFSSAFTLLRSMIGDLVEVERANSGTDRSGLYYALLTAAFKTGASMAIGIPYILLGVLVGFDPTTENSPAVIQNMMYVFVGVPFVFYCLAGLIIRGYPITRAAHAEALAAKTPAAV